MTQRVAIVGAGPAGLTTAYRLGRRPGIETILLEKEATPGGRVRSASLPDGFHADDSAQFLCGNYRQTLRLIRELGLQDRLEEIDPRTFSAVYREGRLDPLPGTLTGLMTTRSFPLREKLALLRLSLACARRYRRGACVQPALLRRFDGIRLSEFVSRRFGANILDEVVEPFAAMTMSHAEEQSLAHGVSMAPIALAKHYAFSRGNGTFTQGLAARCPSLRLGTAVKRVVIEEQRALGVELAADGSILEADSVVCATPAQSAARLLPDLPGAARFLAGIPYSACVQALFGTGEPFLPCWGVAVPRSFGSLLSSVTEETFKSRARAPKGAGLTQAFVIGQEARKLMALDDKIVADRIWEEIRRLFPRYPERLFARIIRREHAMVTQRPGYQRELSDFNASIAAVRGLHGISDYQSNPLIEGSVALAECVARSIRQSSALEA